MAEDGWSGTLRVVREGKVLLERSVGTIDGEGGAPVIPGTRFQAASISKQVLAVAVLQLADTRALTLRDPVDRWLKGLPAAWRELTLYALLTHTSGLGHWGDIPSWDIESPPSGAERDALLEAAAPLLHPPGTRMSHSGIGYVLAARVLEAVTGQPYGEYVQASVFDAAGMDATTSGRFPLGDGGVARGHHHGEPVDVAPSLTAIPGTGDLWTSAADLTSFALGLRSGALISAAALAEMRTAWTATSSTQGPILTLAYGYGSFSGSIAGRRAWFHAGDNPGYRSLLAWLPDEGVDMVVLTNDDGPPLDLPVRLAMTGVTSADPEVG